VVIIAAEVTAVAQLFKFQFDPSYLRSVDYPRDTLEWTSTQNVNPAIFVALFLVFILVINMLRVRWYGEIEYWFGCAKMVFIVGLIMFNITNNARTSTGFKYYNSPWGFQSRNFTTVHNGTQTIHTGGSAHLAAMWTAMTTTIFSMIGFETVAITAPENRLLREKETIKLASRKISLRIILLYTLSAFTVGLNVPYDDSYLRDLAINSLKTGEHSAFIIAAVRDHVLGFPHFFNGFFIFSATSAGLNALYVSSRLLHALAVCPDVWPRWGSVESLRTRLAHTYSGVPRGAVFASWLFGLLAFLAIKPEPAVVSTFSYSHGSIRELTEGVSRSSDAWPQIQPFR
jgi:amino acid transporter